MRVCILTSNKTRHRYMANRIAKRFNVVGVFSEAKQPKRHLAEKVKHQDLEGAEEIATYLNGFAEAEKRYLMPAGFEFDLPKGVPMFRVDPDRLNEPELRQTILSLKPDCFAVFGTSLVRQDLLDLSPCFTNIHLGLSPYYRGVVCSFWPFFNNEPEYVGVTVFYLDAGIDSGPIIHQGLVDLDPGDGIHDASVKAILTGVDLQIKALEERAESSIVAHPQNLDIGRVYYNRDFTVHALRDCLSRWDEEAMLRYVENQHGPKGRVRFIP